MSFDAVVCLAANSEGGDLFVGIVEDDGTITGAARGTPRCDAAYRVHSKPDGAFGERTRNDASSGRRTGGPGSKVPKSTQIVATSDGVVQRRRLKFDGKPECVPFLPHEFASRFQQLGMGFDYTARAVDGASLDDLDPFERQRLREVHRRYREQSDPVLDGLTDEDLDGVLELTRGAGAARRPTIAGLLLVGREQALREHVPTHEIGFQVFSGHDLRVNHLDRAPLLRSLEWIEEQVKFRNEQQEVQDGLFRVTIPTIQLRSFREALLNAVAHRDYARIGPTYVQWKADVIEISNALWGS